MSQHFGDDTDSIHMWEPRRDGLPYVHLTSVRYPRRWIEIKEETWREIVLDWAEHYRRVPLETTRIEGPSLSVGDRFSLPDAGTEFEVYRVDEDGYAYTREVDA